MLERSDMHNYQTMMSEWAIRHDACGLLCEMGVGKTIITLTTLVDLINRFEVGRTLIVAPKRVSSMTWPNEVKAWAHTRHIKYVSRERLLAVKESSDIYFRQAKREVTAAKKVLRLNPKDQDQKKRYSKNIRIMRKHMRDLINQFEERLFFINVDNYVWLIETMGPKWIWDTVVIDESSMFRNPQSKRFRAHKKVMPWIDRCYILTGTPAPNGYMGLWSQIYMLDSGERLGRTITAYRDKYFTLDHTGFNYLLRDGAKEKIDAKISDIVVSMKAEDYMEMGPEPIVYDHELEMPDKLRKQYKELEKEFYLAIQDEEITALTAGVLSNKLRQFCNGSIYTAEKKIINVHNLKLDVLEEIMDSIVGEPMIVGYEFIPDKEKIIKKFKYARTIDQFDQQMWDGGEIEMLVMHPASGGHGLNLQHGGYMQTWYGVTWDLELYQQLNERIGQVRQTQSGYNRAPIYNRIYFKDTVEERLIKCLSEKDMTQASLLDAVKYDIKQRI